MSFCLFVNVSNICLFSRLADSQTLIFHHKFTSPASNIQHFYPILFAFFPLYYQPSAGFRSNTTYNDITINKASGGVSFLGTTTIGGTLTINTGTLSFGAFTTTVNGQTNVTGTLNITSTTGTKTFVGLVTINSGGTWNNSANEAVTFRGGITHNGTTFTAGTGVHTFDTNGQAIGGTTAISIPNITVTGVTLTNTNSTSLTVGTALSGTGGLTQGTGATLNIGGTSAITTLTATVNPNTINYTSTTANQTVTGTTYHHLTINKSGRTATLGGVTTVNGDLIIAAGTLNTGANTFTANGVTNITGTFGITSATGTKIFFGLVTINSGGRWNNSGNGAVTFRGGITHNGATFSAGTGVHTFDTSSQAIGGTTAISIPSVTVTGVTLTNNTTLTVGTALSGTGGLTQGSGATLNIGGTSGITTLTASAGGNVVNYNGASAQTIHAAIYVTLKSNNTAGATLGDATTLTILTIGDVTANSVISDGGYLITLSGSSVLNLISGACRLGSATNGTAFPSFDTLNIASGTTIDYASGVSQTVSAAPGYRNLTVSGAGTKTPDSSLTITGNLTVNASGGTFNLGTALNHTVSGNVILTAGSLDGGSSTLNISGNWTGSGTFTANAGTVVFAGMSAQTIGSAATTFNHLSINKASNTASLGATTVVKGTLTITAGTLAVGGVGATVNGPTNVTGTLNITSATGTKIFVGLVTINSGGTWNNSANGAVTFRGGITHNGATFTSGTGVQTFDTSSQAIGGTTAISIPSVTVTGVTLTNNTTLTVGTALSGTGGLTQGSGAILNIGGTSAITTLTATANPNTINYNSTTAAQTVKAAIYHHLTINKTGQTATLGGVTTVNGDLIIAAGTLNTGANTLTANGITDITGTFGITNATGTKIFVGLVTINSGGTWNNSANALVTFRGGITHNGATFTAGTGVQTFDTSSQAIGGTTAISIPNITVTGVTLTNNTTLTVGTALSGTGGLTQGSGAILNIGGTSAITTLTATANPNTINYNSTTAAQTVKAAIYHHLTINKTGQTATLGGVTTVNGDLIIAAGTLNTGANTLTANGITDITGTFGITNATGTKIFVGLVTINSGGTWNNSANALVTFRGGITHNGATFTAGTGVQIFDTSSQAIGGTTAISIPSVTVTGVTLTNNTTLTVDTAMGGTGGLAQGSGATLNIGGTSGIATLTAAANPNTVNYTSTTATQTVFGTTYHHLTINKPGQTATLGGVTTVNGALTITTGTLNTSANTLTVNGITDITDTLGITSATGTKIFVGLVTINSGGAWNNSANGAVTFQGGITHNGTSFIAGTGMQTFDTNDQTIGGTTAISIPNITVTGVTLTNNTTLTVDTAMGGTGGLTQGSGATLNIGGTSGIATLTAAANPNTVNYTSTIAAQTVIGTTYHHLTINKSGQTATLGGATTVNGDLIIIAGTLHTSGSNFALVLNGSFTNGDTFTANGSNITIGGTSPTPGIAGFATTGALFFNRTASTAMFTGNVTAASLTINGGGGTLNLGASLSHTIDGNITLTAGILNGNSSSLSLTGNWHNNDTFSANSGVVIFNGASAQAIGGTAATAFNNLIISNASLPVSVNTNFSVTGTLTVNANTVLSPAETW